MKKRYVVDLDGEQHNAVVARRGDAVEVAVDENAARPANYRSVLDGRALSLRYGRRLHLVHLSANGGAGAVDVTVNGRPVPTTVMDELRAQALESMGTAAGSGTISADIPGLVVELKVEPGQKVHQGEPVIVVEAMKMQNELCAAVAGTVAEVPVAAGQSVNPGDPLVVIEPEPGG
jgi:biotin carboxyl carrier protein